MHLTDRKLHRKGRTVAALPDHHTADTDDPALARSQVTFDITVVILVVRRWHQDFHIFSNYVGGVKAEQSFRRGAERLNQTALVDDHHGVGNAVENRLQMRAMRFEVLRAGVCDATKAQKDGAAP